MLELFVIYLGLLIFVLYKWFIIYKKYTFLYLYKIKKGNYIKKNWKKKKAYIEYIEYKTKYDFPGLSYQLSDLTQKEKYDKKELANLIDKIYRPSKSFVTFKYNYTVKNKKYAGSRYDINPLQDESKNIFEYKRNDEIWIYFNPNNCQQSVFKINNKEKILKWVKGEIFNQKTQLTFTLIIIFFPFIFLQVN